MSRVKRANHQILRGSKRTNTTPQTIKPKAVFIDSAPCWEFSVSKRNKANTTRLMGAVERNMAAFLAGSRRYKRPIDVTIPNKPKTTRRIASKSRRAIEKECA